MELNITGKTVLITGADSGIGLSVGKFMVQEGVNIIHSNKTGGELKKAERQVASMAAKNATVDCRVADISKNSEIMQLANYIEKKYGGVYIVFHSAGVRGAAGDFLKLTDEDWKETIEIDLMRAVRIARAFITQMQNNSWGRLIFVSSENAFQPYEEESPHSACKASVINLSKCLSKAYSRENILINCISPAFLEKPLTDAMMKEVADKRNSSIEEAEKWFAKNKRSHCYAASWTTR